MHVEIIAAEVIHPDDIDVKFSGESQLAALLFFDDNMMGNRYWWP